MTYKTKAICIREMEFSNEVSSSEILLWLKEIDELIQQQKPFVLIMRTLEATHFSHDYRKLQATWYKKNKAAFFANCIGLVRIAQDQKDLERLNTSVLHDAWKVPYFVTLTNQKALSWAVERFV